MDASTPDATNDATPFPAPPETTPGSDGSPEPIGQLVSRDDFPECLAGRLVDIGGHIGTVTAVVRQSIKVRSREGTTTSFNAHGLRRIYGPKAEAEPPPLMEEPPPAPRRTTLETPDPVVTRNVIENPDFTQEVRAIRQFAGERDFPDCALGRHVDIRGFAGVVVEIVHHSLKVRSRDGVTLSFNADVLRKLHGR